MKKKLPLDILKSLEKFVTLQGEQFDVIEPGNFLLRVKDKDPKSIFYFNVEQYKQDSAFRLLIDFKPRDRKSVENHETWILAKDLQSQFDEWVTILKEYDKVKSFYDDPIIKTFADSYYAEFEIVDENADFEPFLPNQILMIDKHLNSISKGLRKYQQDKNALEIDEIKADIIELRDNLTSKSKKWIIKRLSIIWAKITKQGPKLMKDLLSETKKQLIIEGAKMIISTGIEILK
jgi:hypothetical protein